MSDHPHKQIIYRIQLLQIESQIVNQGHSSSLVHQSLNSPLAKNAANLDLAISFIHCFIYSFIYIHSFRPCNLNKILQVHSATFAES